MQWEARRWVFELFSYLGYIIWHQDINKIFYVLPVNSEAKVRITIPVNIYEVFVFQCLDASVIRCHSEYEKMSFVTLHTGCVIEWYIAVYLLDDLVADYKLGWFLP